MLVPRPRPEWLVIILRGGYTGEEDRPLLHVMELAEVSTEEDDGNATKVLGASTKPTELFIHGVQCVCVLSMLASSTTSRYVSC